MMSTSHRLPIYFVLLALCVGCGKDKVAEGDKSKPAEKPPANTAPPPKETKPQPEAKGLKEPDYKFTVEEFDEATKDERKNLGAKSKYADKVLELSGVVEFPIVETYDEKQAAFTLKSSKPRTGLDSFSVTCMCDDRSVYGTLGRGQKLRVRGVYIGGALKPCEIVEKGPDTAVRVNAEQLATEFTANWDDAVKKYDGKTLILTGTVSKIKPYGPGLTINCLELKGDGKTVVECRYNKPKVADEYKVGDVVKLVGSNSLSERGVLNIVPCYPLSK